MTCRGEQRALPIAFADNDAPPRHWSQRAASRAIKPPEIVRAEANFLRFPFFALHTKGLRQRDGVEWSWPQLTDRMGITCGGEIEAKLKDAVRRTAGVLITTNYALTTVIGKDRHLLPSDEHGYHLYDGYRFRNERLHDGTRADCNCVWLNEWYLTNLNSLYSGPLHHPTWLALDTESCIASRLYEFLLFNAKATDSLRIDYATLCNFLPIKLERYPSDAERQLANPFALARRGRVVDKVTWTLGSRGQMQLVIRFGPRLRGVSSSGATAPRDWADLTENVEIRELRNSDTPAAEVVRVFHRLWSGNQNYRPLKSELALADDLMERYGRKRLEAVLPKVVRTMQRPGGFPTAKMFTATRPFIEEIAAADTEDQTRRQRDRKAMMQERIEFENLLRAKRSRQQRRSDLERAWNAFSRSERAQIEDAAFAHQNGNVLKVLKL